MSVRQLGWAGAGVADDRSLHVKNGRFALAQRADSRDSPQDGLVRVLGCWGNRTKHIPPGKKHELWIPLPAETVTALPISNEAIQRFEELADERTDADSELPYEPRDTLRNLDNEKEGTKLRLKPNDMVYFDISPDGSEVVEISYSAIWRGRVEHPKTRAAFRAHDFFRQIDPELPPFGPERTQVALVEQMLGFVEERDPNKKYEDSGLALAGRLRFADARARDGETADDLLERQYVLLKILGGPKPPCPPMYFSPVGVAGFVEKRDVSKDKHRPNGRKWYLHARSGEGEEPWRTAHPADDKKQKNSVRPIRRGKEFFFHIDFDNLDETELGLLLFALEPDPAFHHKLGMGKPLGLGSVKIEVLGIFGIDRQNRYSLAGLRQPRYSDAEYPAPGLALREAKKWPERYDPEGRVEPAAKPRLAGIREEFGNLGIVADRVRQALKTVGDYARAPLAAEVRYPTTADQRDKELEHYKWFVFNTGQRYKGRGMSPSRQSLEPLGAGKKLQPLEELVWDR